MVAAGEIAKTQARPNANHFYHSIPQTVAAVQREQEGPVVQFQVGLQPAGPAISLDDLKAKAQACNRRRSDLQNRQRIITEDLQQECARLEVLLSLIDPFDEDLPAGAAPMNNPYKDAQLFIGVDPGPKVLGLVVYAVKPGETLGTVILADGKADPIRARQVIAALAADHPIVVLEHTHPGPPSWAVIHVPQSCWGASGSMPASKRCRSSCSAQDIKALLGNSDSAIRRSICELHGYKAETLHPAHEGRLHGVSSHAWQALAAVLFHIHKHHHPIIEEDTP